MSQAYPCSEVLIAWCKPTPGWIKVNTDGAKHGPLGIALFGGVIRDDEGCWLMGFVHNDKLYYLLYQN